MSQKGNVDPDKLPAVSLGINDPRKLESIILMSPENRKSLHSTVCTLLIRHLRFINRNDQWKAGE